MCIHKNQTGIKPVEKTNQGQLVFCQRCGKIIYQYANGKSKRTGCKTTTCINHLPHSQNMTSEELIAVRK